MAAVTTRPEENGEDRGPASSPDAVSKPCPGGGWEAQAWGGGRPPQEPPHLSHPDGTALGVQAGDRLLPRPTPPLVPTKLAPCLISSDHRLRLADQPGQCPRRVTPLF